jgi:hypothetical protein
MIITCEVSKYLSKSVTRIGRYLEVKGRLQIRLKGTRSKVDSFGPDKVLKRPSYPSKAPVQGPSRKDFNTKLSLCLYAHEDEPHMLITCMSKGMSAFLYRKCIQLKLRARELDEREVSSPLSDAVQSTGLDSIRCSYSFLLSPISKCGVLFEDREVQTVLDNNGYLVTDLGCGTVNQISIKQEVSLWRLIYMKPKPKKR